MKIRQVIQHIQADYIRLVDYHKKYNNLKNFLNFLLAPGFWCVILYRFSRYFYVNGLKLPARLLYLANLILWGADISPKSDIGKGVIILHTSALIISGKIGENATVTAKVGLGGDGSGIDVGAGPGLPVAGDNVFFGAECIILGPYKIGNGVFIGARSLVIQDIPAGKRVLGGRIR